MLIIFLTEYEMCIQDILELQWHLDCKSCRLRQVQNQILNTETVNRRIQDDIDFMKKYSPLLEKKLNLEEAAVKDVLLTYEKVNANKDSLRNFPLHRNELKHSVFTWTEYCTKLKETEEKIIKDEKHLEELVKQKAEIQEDAKRWSSKVNNLNNKLAAQGNESRKISDAYSEVVEAVEELKSTRERDLQSIKRKLLNISESLNILKHENEELERENEDFLNKSRHRTVKFLFNFNSSRKQEMYQSEIKTACRRMCKIEEEIERLNEDLYNAALSYSEKNTKYLDLKKNKTEEEVSFKDRIQAIYDDLEEKQKENLKKREEDMKRIEQIEGQVADLETKLKRNKDILKEKSEQNIQMVFNHLRDELAEYEKRLKQEEETYGGLLQIRKKDLKDLERMSDLKSKWLHWQYVDGKMGHNNFVDYLFDDFNITTLDQLMKENLWLAQEYQIIQNYYLNIKEDLIELYGKKIRVETAVRDHQQVKC
ncbi:hypothetical protein Q9233_010579 [Columba guinea]|nr:hypothetical protein Q9233_010579 [Columba guinea]